MIALVEICEKCGTRYQGPALLSDRRTLLAAMMMLQKHCPSEGRRLEFVCPKCDPSFYAHVTDAEREVWSRAERRGRGELLPELEANDFVEVMKRIGKAAGARRN